MGDEMDEILKTFFEECDELLPELERGLGELTEEDSSKETINAIFRAVHSIKGGAASFGLERLVRFAHMYESALDCLRSDKIVPTAERVKIFFSAMDVLSDLVAEAKGTGDAVNDERIDDNLKNLEEVIKAGDGEPPISTGESSLPENFEPVAFDFDDFDLGDSEASSGADHGFLVTFKPHADLYVRGDDARNLLLGLKELLPEERRHEMAVTCVQDGLPELAYVSEDDNFLSWKVTLPGDGGQKVTEENIREVFEWVSDVCYLKIEPIDDGGPDQGGQGKNAPPEPDLAESEKEPEVPSETSVAHEDSTQSPSQQENDQRSDQRVAQPKSEKGEPAAKPARRVEQSASIRVDLRRISALMDMVGEMVIGQASLESELGKHGALQDQELLKRLATMRSLTRDIQSAIMAVRAQPVRSVFQRMHRVVREASNRAGKDIVLMVEGQDTEVDRTLIEHLSDPLTHMLRNAIDHGIESREGRIAAGKPEQGTIWLSAMHRSGRVLIDIKDDGGGINQERVLQTAIKRGIVPADAQLSDDEINELIFAPGFSTASQVSDLSGRGVGMDVVRQSIQTLGGRVSIKSTQGEGTLFSLSMPLTLAVLDGMLIECHGSTMVVPVSSVVELMTVRVAKDVYVMPDGSSVVLVRNRCMPLIYLGQELQLPLPSRESEKLQNQQGEDQLITLIVENEAGARAALVVDGIKDQAQVVIKSIEKNYRRIQGVSAATIMGDGSVSLILDVSTLIAGAIRRMDTRAVEKRIENAA